MAILIRGGTVINQGGGTIAFDPITMSLIVKQTAEVHYMLGGVGR